MNIDDEIKKIIEDNDCENSSVISVLTFLKYRLVRDIFSGELFLDLCKKEGIDPRLAILGSSECFQASFAERISEDKNLSLEQKKLMLVLHKEARSECDKELDSIIKGLSENE